MQREVEEWRARVKHRFPTPDLIDCFLFIVSEVGELADALIRMRGGRYARNRAEEGSTERVIDEIGDVGLMLTSLASHFEARIEDAIRATMDKVDKRIRE